MTARGATSRDHAGERARERAGEPADEPGAEEPALPVGEVSRLAGVTIRTLHHYDDIGLVRASVRTGAGYRLYTPDDLGRLHAVLAYRELGFGLEDIKALLDGATDALEHLRRQHRLVRDRISRLQELLTSLETTMEAHTMGIRLTPQERFEVFGEHDPAQYAHEAQERWGETDAYRQSMERTSRYGKQDWLELKAEAAEVEGRLAGALRSGTPADGPVAVDAAEAHRQHISRWFYDCSHEMHVGLADMYVADPRFTSHYEKVAAGLAQYVHDAIHANALRAAG